MKLKTEWKNKMQFSATDETHTVLMDAKPPFGDNSSLSPKQLLLAGVSGCTAMDVVGLLKKTKQKLQSLEVLADAPSTEASHPVIFTKIDLHFIVTGDVSPESLIGAVKLSQSKFCGVSAMVSKAVPIFYKISLNGDIISEGKANFSF